MYANHGEGRYYVFVRRWPQLLSIVVLGACGAVRPIEAPPESSYLTSARYRRAALEASLVNPSNDYSRLRLAHYARAGDWDALPEWNPEVSPITRSDLPQGAADTRALEIDLAARRGSVVALRALGEEAFFRYPVQVTPSARVALTSPATENSYGLWSDKRRGVGGFVRVSQPVGQREPFITCSTCHARLDPGDATRGLIVGVGNNRLDLGRIYIDGGAIDGDVSRIGHLREWGRGRMDVTTTRGDEPMRIPDLRPVRFLSHLHQDATLLQTDVTALAIRIETLIIVSSRETTRPPREVALGLALYLWSLGEALPMKAPTNDAEERGRAVFDAQCKSCHAPPTFSGPPVPLAVIGTDATVGRSRDRGTGTYRVPSLRGVTTRGPLLHDGSVGGVEALFDPGRKVRGHEYGMELDTAAHDGLLAYLHTL